jgi:RimJ/RimL family protein N-acetyltransferase
MERLLQWRNDPETRKASIGQAPIPPDEHARWFAAQLAAPDVALYIIESGNDAHPCGQVRLNRLRDGGALVSIGLDSSCRGRGIGAAALRAVQAPECRPHWAATLYAVIRLDNPASRRAFEAAGFRGPSATADAVGALEPGTGVWTTENDPLGRMP